MKRIQTTIRKGIGPFLLSIILPIIILGIVYYRQGIYLGSETTLLASDAYAQLANFYAAYRDALIGKESFFYSWSGALGGNFWSLSAYYLNSLFTFIVIFFSKITMPDAFYVITLLKFGAIGGSFYLYAQHNYAVKKWISVSVSLCYTLMSFSVAYSPINMWLDALLYLPLIIWGINRILQNRKPWLLFSSYTLLFLSNYYIGFIVGVFTVLYVLLQIVIFPSYKNTFFLYLRTAILAGGTAMVVILPSIIDLRANGETLSPVNQFFTPDTGGWDLIAKQFVGAYDTAKFESAPFVFVGLIPLLFGLFFFFSRQISFRKKISNCFLGLFLIGSVYIYPLNLFWHGLHFPNMFLFRFSFLFSFLLCIWALQVIETWKSTDLSSFLNVSIGTLVLFCGSYFILNPKRYGYLSGKNVLWTAVFLFLYLFLIVCMNRVDQPKKKIVAFVFVLCIGSEMGINATQMIKGVEKDWGYPSLEAYSASYDDIQTLVSEVEKRPAFHRILNEQPITLNESYNFGYSGLTQFSSVRNRSSLLYLNQMGYRSEGTNLSIEGLNNTLIMNSFMGVESIIGKNDPLLFGYEKKAESGAYQLYRTPYSLPLGVLTDDGIYNATNVSNQTKLWNYLSQTTGEYVQVTSLENEKLTNGMKTEQGKSVVYSQTQPGDAFSMEWEVSVPKNTQAYLSMYSADNAMMKNAKATVTVQGQTETYDMAKIGQYYSLGHYEEATTIPVKVSISGTSVVQFPTPTVLLLNTERFANATKEIQKKGVDLDVKKNRVSGTVTADKESVVLTTIAYDSGWTLRLDGEKKPLQAFENGLLSFSIPKGHHQIELLYYPSGLFLGLGLSIGSICLFLTERIWMKRKREK
ncbi:copper ABC transporter permease [Enterococcus plantarum]|uniref:Copper ABC transporter permease n=1 Tax=Enterococcus plantarum TaxID=1077675 RepID=A0A2W4BUK2_9ENTE|nr:YfhO family protein [Enterococcus plantarum]PZL77512.1 copper ABC transporter permease [Enterococcus plantarum]